MRANRQCQSMHGGYDEDQKEFMLACYKELGYRRVIDLLKMKDG